MPLLRAGVFALLTRTLLAARTCPLLPSTSISCERDGALFRDPVRFRYCDTTRNGHVFHASWASPIAHTFPNETTEHVEYFQRALSNLTATAREQTGKKKCSPDEWPRKNRMRDDIVTELQNEWVSAIIVKMYSIGLTPSGSQCFSQVLLPVNDPYTIQLFSNLEKLMTSMSVGATRLKQYMRSRPRSYLSRIMDCSDKLYVNMDKPVINDAYHCRLLAIAGMRRNGTFAIPLSYTASPTGLHRHERRYVLENIIAKSGALYSLPVRTYKRDNSSMQINDSSTTFSAWPGQVGAGHFMNMPTEETPAMQNLRRVLRKDEDNLHSSVTLSNIAILLFPALLTLIPISCVELVNFKTLLVYIFFSDFLTVLPLAVKGVDLILHAAGTHTSCAAYTVGAESSPNEVAAVELWCAQCGVHKRFDTIGKILFGVAIFFLALGIAIELHAYKSLRRTIKRIKERGSDRHRWWQRPAIVQYANKRCPPCESCSCDSGLSHRSFSSSLIILKSELWEQ